MLFDGNGRVEASGELDLDSILEKLIEKSSTFQRKSPGGAQIGTTLGVFAHRLTHTKTHTHNHTDTYTHSHTHTHTCIYLL